MFALAVEVAIVTVFKNYLYTFGGRTFRQKSGAPTGNRLTMCCARVQMGKFNSLFKEKMREAMLKVWMGMIYVDDGRHVLRMFDQRIEYNPVNRRLTRKIGPVQQLTKAEKRQHTRTELLKLMNSISPSLSFTTELEEDFGEGWIPTLDTKVRMTPEGKIEYRFYEKEMASEFTLMDTTAISDQMKQATGTSKVIRRLMNTEDEEAQQVKDKILEDYIRKLEKSKYPEQKIRKIMMTGITAYERIYKMCKRTGKDLHRANLNTKSWRIKRKLLA